MEFLPILKSLTNFNKVCIDNTVFKLHYRLTCGILLFCGGLVTFRQYIAQPIQCISDEPIKEIMDTYCWIHSTSTIAKRDPVTNKFAYKDFGYENDALMPEIRPGVGPVLENDKVRYHTYYQWIWIVLLLQAVLFYLPHWFWKEREGGKIKMLVSELQNPHVISEGKKEEQRQYIINYLTNKKVNHKNYGFQFLFCEVLNFVNVIAQIYFTDAYLGNEFTKNGWKILNFIESKPYERSDVLARVFPTVTACSIGRFGPTGKIVMHDTLCVLPINILNEKIYITLWFWFILIAIMSAVAILYRLLIFTTPFLRRYEMRRHVRSVEKDVLNTVSTRFGFGDWFLLMQLGKNIGAISFGELLKKLACACGVENPVKPLIHKTNHQEVEDIDNIHYTAKDLEMC